MASSAKINSSTNPSRFPLAGIRRDGWSTEDRATATCFCGAVQLSFPTQGPGLVKTFVCHCTDCRKITASMFASNFIVNDSYLIHERGQDQLKTFANSTSIAGRSTHDAVNGPRRTMTNHFCGNCGTLMYRVGTAWPNASVLRIGTVDDFELQETKLRPQVEQWVEDRVEWLEQIKEGKDLVRTEGLFKGFEDSAAKVGSKM